MHIRRGARKLGTQGGGKLSPTDLHGHGRALYRWVEPEDAMCEAWQALVLFTKGLH